MTERERPARHHRQSKAPVRPRWAYISEFEQKYFSLFNLEPDRLFKFIQTQFDEPDVADMIVQRDPNLIIPDFRNHVFYTINDADNWSDVNTTDDDDDNFNYDPAFNY